MIAADVVQAAQVDQPEVVRVEEVIQREPEQRVLRVVAVEEAAPDARVQQPAEAQEQPGRVAPRDVVQVAGHDRGRIGGIVADRTTHEDELGVTRRGILVVQRLGRPRVQAVQIDDVAALQADPAVNRRDVRLHLVTNLGVHQLQPAQQHHAVVVVAGLRHHVRPVRDERAHRAFHPHVVDLDGEDDVGVGGADDLTPLLERPVFHQDVRRHQADRRRGVPSAFSAQHLLAGERRVRVDVPYLNADDARERCEEHRIPPAPVACPRPRRRDDRRECGGKHTGEVPAADVPVGMTAEVEQRAGDEPHARCRERPVQDSKRRYHFRVPKLI